MNTLDFTTVRLLSPLIEYCPISEAETLLGDPPSLREYLSGLEASTLGRLATPKRRREWLAGRLAAKRALIQYLSERGIAASPGDMEIRNSPERRPYAAFPSSWNTRAPALSISHARDYAGCAVLSEGAVGLDIERIEPRDPSWPWVMADPSELDDSLLASPARLTALWTIKEAVLKALGLGLSVDLRDLRVEGGRLELRGAALRRWQELLSPRVSYKTSFFDEYCSTVATARNHGNQTAY